MSFRASAWRQRADFRAASGVLLVLRQPPAPPPPSPGQPAAVPGNPAEGPEVLLALVDEGEGRLTATALAGHVDLGTGIRTAYGQVVAEELHLPLDAVQVVLGDTGRAPNQGPTIASASLQLHAQPLRVAAAQARAWLVGEAAAQSCAIGGGLLTGRHVELWLDMATPTKPSADYTVVGTSVPRIDLPAKATGGAVYVHDVRLPGMLHGRVVRPPYAGLDAGPFVGHSLLAVDEASIATSRASCSWWCRATSSASWPSAKTRPKRQCRRCGCSGSRSRQCSRWTTSRRRSARTLPRHAW